MVGSSSNLHHIGLLVQTRSTQTNDVLLHVVPGAMMTTVGAQGRCNGNGVTKEPGNSRKHLIQMFYCRMEECSSAAKRSTNIQYVCKYIGRINDRTFQPRGYDARLQIQGT